MIRLPLSWVEWAMRYGPFRRPAYLSCEVEDGPLDEELKPTLVYNEIRGGHQKWAHLACPQCGEHIQLPVAHGSQWRIEVDFLNRPTIDPSVWELDGCGAHFFIRSGKLLWCRA